MINGMGDENKTNAQVAVIYHAECPDGFAGAFAAWRKYGPNAEYIPLHHTSPLPVERIKGCDVFCIDFTYGPGHSLDLLLEHAHRVILIDHHKSSESILGRFDEKHFSIEHSAAVLAWQYFYPNTPVPKLFQRIESIDLGRFSDPEVRETDRILTLTSLDFKEWDGFVEEFEDDARRAVLLRDGALLDQYMKIQLGKLLNHAEVVSFEGYRCLMVNSPVHVSYIGKALYEKMPPIGIVWSRRCKDIVVSLRSDGTVDVAAIAEKYGGGGHKQAAAFSWEQQELLSFFAKQ